MKELENKSVVCVGIIMRLRLSFVFSRGDALTVDI